MQAIANLVRDQEYLINLDYLVASLETGESGTPHLQMYVEWSNPKTLSATKKKLGSKRWHLEQREGTPFQATKYCLKEVEPMFEYGERPKEIQYATVWDALEDTLRHSNASELELIKMFPTTYAKYTNAFYRMINLVNEEKVNQHIERETHYVWGAPRTGKTRGILQKHGANNVYRVTNYANPFDGYKGQSVILFEEFRSSLPIHQMLIYLDCYINILPARYNDKVGIYDTVYIVSNIPLEKQYPNTMEGLVPFYARITSETKVENCTTAHGSLKGNTRPLETAPQDSSVEPTSQQEGNLPSG
jgi:hypothetical protein